MRVCTSASLGTRETKKQKKKASGLFAVQIAAKDWTFSCPCGDPAAPGDEVWTPLNCDSENEHIDITQTCKGSLDAAEPLEGRIEELIAHPPQISLTKAKK